jgi:hypothetical protein
VGKGGQLRRTPNFIRAFLLRRRYYMVIAAVLVAVIAVLLLVSASLPEYGKNLSLNLGADLIGALVVLFVIAPFMGRAERSHEAVLERFDHRAFIRQAGDARHRILILELWTDLLQGGYQRAFLDAIRDSLARDVEVRILLLDPDARAAEQREDDLLRQTNVVDNILDNLRVLHEFQRDLPDRMRRNLDVRVYSALPPVQLYRVDDHLIVSFYPVNVTSWNAAQYQTSPQAQLGTFVGTKFDELWEARSTRTLEQFRQITLEVDGDESSRSYHVLFVSAGEKTYVSGHAIVADNLRNGINELPARLIHDNAKGETHHSARYSITPLDPDAEDLDTARELFRRKYGQDRQDVILKLTAPGTE